MDASVDVRGEQPPAVHVHDPNDAVYQVHDDDSLVGGRLEDVPAGPHRMWIAGPATRSLAGLDTAPLALVVVIVGAVDVVTVVALDDAVLRGAARVAPCRDCSPATVPAWTELPGPLPADGP